MKQQITRLFLMVALGSGLLVPPSARAQCIDCIVIKKSGHVE
jgi:hypothetical protein